MKRSMSRLRAFTLIGVGLSLFLASSEATAGTISFEEPAGTPITDYAFGSVPVSTSAGPVTITVRNTGTASNPIAKSETGDTTELIVGALSTTDLSGDGDTATFDVTCTPGATKALFSVSIEISGGTNDPATLTVTCDSRDAGVGISDDGGDLNASTTIVDFGDTPVGGSSATHTVTVSHQQGGSVSGLALSTTGDTGDFVVGALSGTSVSNGSPTVTFTVQCTPTTIGARNARVTVTNGSGANEPFVDLDCNGADGEITLEAGPKNAGQVAFGDDADVSTVSFNVSNDGNADLTNFNVVSNNSELSVAVYNESNVEVALPATIPSDNANDQWRIDVTFTPSAGHTGMNPTDFSGTITVTSDDASEPSLDRTITGQGVDWLYVTSPALTTPLNFPGTPIGFSDNLNITLQNNGTGTISNITPTFGGGAFTGAASAGNLASGASTNYTVTFTPLGTSHNDTVNFSSTVMAPSTAPTAAVSLTGTGLTVAAQYAQAAPVVVAGPILSADFGQHDIGVSQTKTYTFVFSNAGTANMSITSIVVAGAAFSRAGGTLSTGGLNGGQSRTVGVQSAPTAVGGTSGTLTVGYTVRGQAQTPLVLNLNAEGISTQVSINNTAVDFGVYDVDLPAKEEVVTITNAGGAALNVTALTIENNSGAFSILTPTPPFSVGASGGTQDVRVAYDPNVENTGEPQATLRVTASNGPDITVLLDGEGADRRIAPSPRTVVFDDTFRYPAAPTVGYLDITNSGKAPLNISMAVLSDDDGAFVLRDLEFTSVAPLSTETVEIEFTPTALKDGGYSGTLVIYNDDDNDAMAEIDLVGTAILPNIQVVSQGLDNSCEDGDPNTIDYCQVGVGVTSEVGLKVPVVDIVNLDTERSFQLRELRVVDLAGQPVDPDLFRVRGLENPRMVDPDGSIGLQVEFNPTKEGDFEFILQVFAENDPLPITTAPIRAQAVDVKLRGGGCQSGGSTGLTGLLLALGALFWIRRRRLGAVLALVALFVPTLASAQATRNLELGTFRPTLGAEADFITVDNTMVGKHMAWTVGVGVDHAVDPLTVESEETSMTDTPVAQRTATSLYASFAFLDRYEAGARLPLLSQSGDTPQFSSIDPADGFAVGDLSVEGKMHILQAQPISLAAAAFMSFPTAKDQQFAGAAGFSGGARAIAGLDLGRIRVGANLGYRLRESGALADVVQGDEINYGVAGSYLFMDELQAVAEIVGALGLEGDESGGISPIEARVGARYHFSPTWGIVAGAGRGIVSGIGAPAVRGFLLFSVSPARGTRRVSDAVGKVIMVSSLDPNEDTDGDGMLNKNDECPQRKEDMDGFKDGDGCPDPDNDEDGVLDTVDKCNDVPEDKDGYLDDDGCPELDNDSDNIPDAQDQCPNEPEDMDGFMDEDGCDDFDNDVDGVPDLMDACPKKKETINGRKDDDGCPDRGASAVMILNNQISVLEPISFVGATAKLGKKSQNVLGQVAATFRANPHMTKIGIEVHVHPRGKGDQALSEKRAEAIRTWMLNRGVAKSRLEIQALGSTNPVRKKGKRNAARFNDRVTFKVLKIEKK